MTKRDHKKFERNANDKYFTPPSAIAPLLAHLSEATRFIEPCAGDGRLATFLNRHGHNCVYACDVAPEHSQIARRNALDLTPEFVAKMRASYFITNPPWDRPVLNALLRHLPAIRPTWLLFDADWMHTDLGAQYGRQSCSKIVSIGRVKWIEGSSSVGFDNCCWYLFDFTHVGPPRFYWRQ